MPSAGRAEPVNPGYNEGNQERKPGIMIVGVIGSGAVSDIYLKNMIEKYGELTVKRIASLHIEHARRKAERWHIQAGTVEELLADPEIELAVILTPLETHYDLIKEALLSGKHVYTEKTIAETLEQAKELLALAEEKKLLLGCAPDTFLGPAWATARQLIRSEAIGEIQSFVISVNRNYTYLLSLIPFLRRPGCGLLLDYGVYHITCLCNLLGPVSRVCGITRNPYPERTNILPGTEYGEDIHLPNESQVSALIELSSGVTGTLHMNADSVTQDQAFFALYGTKGILYLTNPDHFGGTLRLLCNDFDSIELTREDFYQTDDENLRGIGAADLARSLMENREPKANKELAYHVLEVLTAILESSENSGSMTSITSAI